MTYTLNIIQIDRHKKMFKIHGFTLFEVVIVILLIGVLAVVAVPRFISFQLAAETSTLNAIAGALSSANTSNYMTRSLNPSDGKPIHHCAQVSSLLQTKLPEGYTISLLYLPPGKTSSDCIIKNTNGISAKFMGTGIR